jgi:uncharacterized protein YecE (DUF72 family)
LDVLPSQTEHAQVLAEKNANNPLGAKQTFGIMSVSHVRPHVGAYCLHPALKRETLAHMPMLDELKQRIRVGASGYSYDDWVGPFYPKGTSKADFLRYYAAKFSVVEVNATYYRVPPPRTFETMVSKTPRDFVFIVKANQDMTHNLSRETSLYAGFLEAIDPLREAGKFDGILLQFPFAFKNEARNRSHLAFLRESLPGMRLWAEFRHESWAQPPVFEFLRRLELGYCAVDEPELEGLMPGIAAVTTDTGYVRFHGRNAATWWGGGHERYDWDYTAEELGEWSDRIRELAAGTKRTYIFFNNCHRGRAPQSAQILRRILGLPAELDLGF